MIAAQKNRGAEIHILWVEGEKTLLANVEGSRSFIKKTHSYDYSNISVGLKTNVHAIQLSIVFSQTMHR